MSRNLIEADVTLLHALSLHVHVYVEVWPEVGVLSSVMAREVQLWAFAGWLKLEAHIYRRRRDHD